MPNRTLNHDGHFSLELDRRLMNMAVFFANAVLAFVWTIINIGFSAFR